VKVQSKIKRRLRTVGTAIENLGAGTKRLIGADPQLARAAGHPGFHPGV
jgi:hypothetical protein